MSLLASRVLVAKTAINQSKNRIPSPSPSTPLSLSTSATTSRKIDQLVCRRRMYHTLNGNKPNSPPLNSSNILLKLTRHESLSATARGIVARGSATLATRQASAAVAADGNIMSAAAGTGLDDSEDTDEANRRRRVISANSSTTTTDTDSTSTGSASATLAPVGFEDYPIKWKAITAPTVAQTLPIWLDLSKARLAALVTLTAMSGYAMAPGASSVATLFSLTAGTALCIASANTYNQFTEPPYDAQMKRTGNRVLVRRAVSPLYAWSFASLTGLTGTALLALAVNPLTAALGAANLALYAAVYTPMKRMSIANTWVGAIVGAIPPMMGWAAQTGGLEPGAWVLGLFLYAWQFPHFNSLAWNLRADYSKAGYRMMSVTDPKLNARVSLRYSLATVPLVLAVPYLDITSWWFAVDGNIVNGILIAGAAKFWRQRDDKSARQLFFGSLIYLPVVLALMMFHKKRQENEGSKLAAVDVGSGATMTTVHRFDDAEDDEYEYVQIIQEAETN